MTKLQPPAPRAQWIVRERLLKRLQPDPAVRLTIVVAPAGSGKTTLLGTWHAAEAERRPVAWVSLDDGDNDPVVLWSHVLESLWRVCPSLADLRRPEAVGAGRIADAVLPDLANLLTEQSDVALILDDFHRLQSGPSRESLAWLVDHAPQSLQLVISTRSEPALPLGALRARGELLELRAHDLGFSTAEADVLLNDRLELGLAGCDVEELVERTEGWPAGLYLAALSICGVEDRHTFVNTFGGNSRHVIDFLVDEVLDGYDAALQTLMIRCSVLDRLSGPLCDTMLELEGSDEQLRELARTNLFLQPLDDHGQWYRFHHLFAQLLRVELRHREPELASTLHARASAWHRDHGSGDEAIAHALDAGDFAGAGDLICDRWIEYAYRSRHATVLAWLERFPPEVIDVHPGLLIVRAWTYSMCGMRDEAISATAAAEHLDGLGDRSMPDGASSVEASIATLRALMPFGDIGAGHANAIRAAQLEHPGSRNWPRVCWSRGVGHFFRGEMEEAEIWFADAARLSLPLGMWISRASALAYQSFIAGDKGDLERQGSFAEQAARVAREQCIDESYFTGEVPLALAAWHAARGALEEAQPLFEQSVSTFRSYGQAIGLAHGLIRGARVLVALGEREAAAAAIAEARATVDACPDPGILEEWLGALTLRRPGARSRQGGTELSKRELVVLRALSGPLSERDIGRELYLSHNTIHSHARSIYRKLGVSSRTEAVRQARASGLF